MRVKCIANTKQAVDAQYRAALDEYFGDDQLFLEIGKSYDVYGLAFRRGHLWYLVSVEDEFDYPYLHLSAFFSVEDARIPPGWALTTQMNNLEAGTSILPAPWASDPYFMERLVDEDEVAIAFFRELKKNGGAVNS